MKNLIFCGLIFLISSLGLNAQTNDITTLAYSVSGKVKYAPSADGKFKKLKPGQLLNMNGALMLKPGAKVAMFADTDFGVIQDAGTFSLEEALFKEDVLQENQLSRVFKREVAYALNENFVSKTFQKAGFTGPTPPPEEKEKDGAGNKNFKILSLQPLTNNVVGGTVVFRWKNRPGSKKAKEFSFKLTDTNGKTLFEQNVKGNSLTLSTNQHQMNSGKSYRWQVKVVGSEDSSPSIEFNYVDSSEYEQIMSDLKKNEMYQQGDEAAKLILAAISLEDKMYYSKAKYYLDLAYKGHKKNGLVRRMYNAFYYEYDLLGMK